MLWKALGRACCQAEYREALFEKTGDRWTDQMHDLVDLYTHLLTPQVASAPNPQPQVSYLLNRNELMELYVVLCTRRLKRDANGAPMEEDGQLLREEPALGSSDGLLEEISHHAAAWETSRDRLPGVNLEDLWGLVGLCAIDQALKNRLQLHDWRMDLLDLETRMVLQGVEVDATRLQAFGQLMETSLESSGTPTTGDLLAQVDEEGWRENGTAERNACSTGQAIAGHYMHLRRPARASGEQATAGSLAPAETVGSIDSLVAATRVEIGRMGPPTATNGSGRALPA